jgi:hypothetical protein
VTWKARHVAKGTVAILTPRALQLRRVWGILMYEKIHRGAGNILIRGREIPVDYEIKSTRTQHKISASGFVTGLGLADRHLLLTTSGIILRLETDHEVEIVFLGGDANSAESQISVNTPMPGAL